jgi:hypothetical protein
MNNKESAINVNSDKDLPNRKGGEISRPKKVLQMVQLGEKCYTTFSLNSVHPQLKFKRILR